MSLSNFTILQAIWPKDRPSLQAVREPVFVQEQGVPLEMEWDDDDIIAYHLLAIDSERNPIGTARMLGNGQIGRMAVLPEWRGLGVGRALLQGLLAHAETEGIENLFLHAQTSAEAFYRNAGFTPQGEIFYEADIPHRKMVLELQTEQQADIDLSLPLLGETEDLFHLHDEHENLIHAASLLRQSKRELSILSLNLDPPVYDQIAFLEGFKTLSLRSRFSRIRILLQDNTLVLQRGHRLIELAQRLPSVVEIRKPNQDFIDLPENFLLADDCGYLHRKASESYHATACYNDRHRVNRLMAIFSDAWVSATPDRDLARLHL
jgi:predicted GNAT family N-acyltransferase